MKEQVVKTNKTIEAMHRRCDVWYHSVEINDNRSKGIQHQDHIHLRQVCPYQTNDFGDSALQKHHSGIPDGDIILSV
jgi:hypothetical protein